MKETHGMHQIPSLIHADTSMLPMLANYEILGCEPLHGIKHRIDNLYTELPQHLRKSERKLTEETIAHLHKQKTKGS